MEGMSIFTEYTNKWKKREEESKEYIGEGERLSLVEIKAASLSLPFAATKKSVPPGDQYKPKLPLPPVLEPTKRRILFVKEVSKIERVAGYLGDADMDPSEVGEKCFDTIYEEARR